MSYDFAQHKRESMQATVIGPENDETLIIADSDEWIDTTAKIACTDGWVELDEWN